MADESVTADETIDDGWRWMLVEIFGHREHAGRCLEVEQVGVKMLRIDEPSLPFGSADPEELRWETHFYPGAAIFSIRQTTEEAVMRRTGVRRPVAITHDAGQAPLDHPSTWDDDEQAGQCEACGDEEHDCGKSYCPQRDHTPDSAGG